MAASPQICIAGGGIVGLASACLLAKQGFTLTLVDNNLSTSWQANQIGGRVSAINVASENLLRHIGVWDDIVSHRATPYTAMQVWDSHSDAFIRFNARDYSLPHLGHIVENDLLATQMLSRLNHNYNVELQFQTRVHSFTVSEDGLQITTVNQGNAVENHINTELLIAVDGAESDIRQQSGIETNVQDFSQLGLVTTVQCEKPHQHTAWQCFTPDGPAALLPLSDRFCSLVWSCDTEKAQGLLNGEPTDLANALTALFHTQLGQIEVTGEVIGFPLVSRHASQYIDTRLALVGDAAHTTHPLAGLGANIGFQDAAALSQVIAEAEENRKPFHKQSVLRRYERWRRGDNELVLSMMKGFKSTFASSHPVTTRLRSDAFNIAHHFEPVKQRLAEYAMGISGDLPNACR